MTSSIPDSTRENIAKAAAVISRCEALVVTAGAGMGVDSGLPDFRGPEGFWRAYPPLKERGLYLPEVSNPQWFVKDPRFAWGFFGHRYNLYKAATPHNGFHIIRKWCEKIGDYFVFTSNVDGHFQKAGFPEEKVVECHGSINFLQCFDTRLNSEIWPVTDDFLVKVDEKTLLADVPLPLGPPGEDNQLVRPNILMFNDYGWVSDRTDIQQERFDEFVATLGKRPFAVIELGAGLAVPTVRLTGESLVTRRNAGYLIRINPREPEVPRRDKDISIPLGGLLALREIDSLMATK